MPNQHESCTEVNVEVGEGFEWIVTANEYCDIKILGNDHPLDKDHYHVIKGIPTPATVNIDAQKRHMSITVLALIMSRLKRILTSSSVSNPIVASIEEIKPILRLRLLRLYKMDRH